MIFSKLERFFPGTAAAQTGLHPDSVFGLAVPGFSTGCISQRSSTPLSESGEDYLSESEFTICEDESTFGGFEVNNEEPIDKTNEINSTMNEPNNVIYDSVMALIAENRGAEKSIPSAPSITAPDLSPEAYNLNSKPKFAFGNDARRSIIKRNNEFANEQHEENTKFTREIAAESREKTLKLGLRSIAVWFEGALLEIDAKAAESRLDLFTSICEKIDARVVKIESGDCAEARKKLQIAVVEKEFTEILAKNGFLK